MPFFFVFSFFSFLFYLSSFLPSPFPLRHILASRTTSRSCFPSRSFSSLTISAAYYVCAPPEPMEQLLRAAGAHAAWPPAVKAAAVTRLLQAAAQPLDGPRLATLAVSTHEPQKKKEGRKEGRKEENAELLACTFTRLTSCNVCIKCSKRNQNKPKQKKKKRCYVFCHVSNSPPPPTYSIFGVLICSSLSPFRYCGRSSNGLAPGSLNRPWRSCADCTPPGRGRPPSCRPAY